MNQDSPLPPDTRGKLLRRVAIIAAVSGLFFIPYIFIPDHWVTTLPDGRMEIIFLRDPLYTLIKYLPVLGGAICIAGGFWISFKKFTAASGLLLAFAVIAGGISAVGRVSNFPAPWRQYSSIAGPDGQVYYYLFRSWRGEQTAALGRLEGHLPLREKIIILGTVTSDSLVNNPQSYCLIPQATAPTIGTRDKFGLLAIHDQGFVIGYAAGNKASFGYELAHGLFLNPEALSALDWK